MSEKTGGGYRELEQEIIEKRISEYVASKNATGGSILIEDMDPRAVEASRTAEQYGFSMKDGQYYDLLK